MLNVRGNPNQKRTYIVSSRQYDEARKVHAQNMSLSRKNKIVAYIDGVPRLISNEDRTKYTNSLSYLREGYVCVRDSNGMTLSVSTNDPRYLSGELKSANVGQHNGMYGKTKELNHFYGKSHTPETKKTIGAKSKKMWAENKEKLLKTTHLHLKSKPGVLNPAAKGVQCLKENCCGNKKYETVRSCADAHNIGSDTVIQNAKGRTAKKKFSYV